MKIYNNFLKFKNKWLSARVWVIQKELKYLVLSATTRIRLIIENMMIYFLYVFISFGHRASYWIDYTGYWISRVSYRILKKKI